MTFFRKFSSVDRISLEGAEVVNVTPVKDRKTKEISHYVLSVADEAGVASLRKFTPDEIEYLFENEKLIIEQNYYSETKQFDLLFNAETKLFRATKKQRAKAELKAFLAKQISKLSGRGMPLTREGVGEHYSQLNAEYIRHQCIVNFGTLKPNSTQSFKKLPHADTLLKDYRKWRDSGGNPACFLPQKVTEISPSKDPVQEEFVLVMRLLSAYACSTKPAKSAIARQTRNEIVKIKNARKNAGLIGPIRVFSARTYERYITKYLDPFTVCLKREGLAAAKAKFKAVELGQTSDIIGQYVQFDAWKFHVLTLDCTRARYNQMTREQRQKVRKVRRWVIVAIDVATRAIVGYSICKSPNQRSSLDALRMCFVDKTQLLRQVGITQSAWNYICTIGQVGVDTGSEFGKAEFGGARFAEAVRMVTSSLLHTVAGVPELRAYIERWFLTCELKFTRNLPGWTASNPQKLNDRVPLREACICDDELEEMFLGFVAEYHATPHRGLNFLTPATAWKNGLEHPEFDMTGVPAPGALRNATGFHLDASIVEGCIMYSGERYSCERLRKLRPERSMNSCEIILDPCDLGAITVLHNGDCFAVPCLNTKLRGKSLREHQSERLENKELARTDALKHEEANVEAHTAWTARSASIQSQSGLGIMGYTDEEVERARNALEFGKGQFDQPFVGELEYQDPLDWGFETGNSNETELSSNSSLDRFRSSVRARKDQHGWEENE